MNAVPPKHNPLLLPVSFFVGILFGAFVFLAAKVNNPPPIDHLDVDFWDLLGTEVPEVELELLDGTPISSHHFKGQKHLLFFTDPNCSACDEVYPVLTEAATRIPILMVAQNSLEATKNKVAELGFTFPVVYDSLEVLTDPLRVGSYPTAMFIDADNRIVKAAGGDKSSKKVIRIAMSAQIEKE